MDKKKLIGTIIGVIMFAALIVGATYAWLTFNATVTNATYNGTTLNYWVDYEGDADGLSDIPILTSPTPTSASSVTVTAQQPSGSIANNITIKLTTTSNNTLTTSGAVNYAICKGACTTDFTSAVGTGTVTSTGTINLLTNDTVTTTKAEYYIYFWLDAETLTNSHLNQTYSGYIHADSTQNTSNYS